MYFGKPVSWKDKLKDNYNKLKDWDFKIFTDTNIPDGGNLEVIKMSMDEFADLVSKKLGVEYSLKPTPDEIYPISQHLYDLWPTQGVLFEDYHKGYDFWGHGCLDMIYGDVDKWLTDEFLSDTDIFGNDPDAICGPFSLYRNIPKINHLFEEIPDWKERINKRLDQPMDEYWMTQVVRKARDEGRIRFKSAFWQNKECDDLSEKDGKFYQHGEEIMVIHFNRIKRWPL